MKDSIRVGYHEAEDRALRDHLKLAWLDGHSTPTRRLIEVHLQQGNWVLVLQWDGAGVAQVTVPQDRVWTVADLMASPHFKGLVQQMKILAKDEAEKQSAETRTKASPAAPRLGGSRLATILSILALVISLAAVALSYYALKVGLGAHVSRAVQSESVGAAAGGVGGVAISDLQGLLGGSLAGAVRLDANTLGPAGMTMLAEAAARTGFSLNNEGQMVIMFADPACPACKQFEEWIAKDGYQTFSPLMVPIAILQGSRDVSAAVLCSRTQADTWRSAIAGTLSSPQTCAEGLSAVDRNNEIFSALGFSQTPTFVAMNGSILVGGRSPQEMRLWAQQNTPADRH